MQLGRQGARFRSTASGVGATPVSGRSIGMFGVTRETPFVEPQVLGGAVPPAEVLAHARVYEPPPFWHRGKAPPRVPRLPPSPPAGRRRRQCRWRSPVPGARGRHRRQYLPARRPCARSAPCRNAGCATGTGRRAPARGHEEHVGAGLGSGAPWLRRSRCAWRTSRHAAMPPAHLPRVWPRRRQHDQLHRQARQFRQGIECDIEALLRHQSADHADQRNVAAFRQTESAPQHALVFRRPARREAEYGLARRGCAGFHSTVSMPLRTPLSTPRRGGATGRRGRRRAQAPDFARA